MKILIVAVVASLLFLKSLAAQTDFYGSIEDVHPFRLTLPEDGPKARLWIGSATREIALEGVCERASCTYSALDTALTLRFLRTVDERLLGTITFGDGRELPLLAHAYDGPSVALELPKEAPQRRSVPANFVHLVRERLKTSRAERADSMLSAFSEEVFAPDFLTRCGSDKWVSAWSTANNDHRLTLATLPGQRLRGSLYLASVQTTFLVQGDRDGREGHLEISRPNGSPVGDIVLMADSTSLHWDRLSAKLDLGAGPQTMRLAVVERVPMGCRQADARFDLMMPFADVTAALPSTPDATTEVTLDQLGWAAWATMRDDNPELGQGWFEPLRLDAGVLSGWLHVQTSSTYATYPVNLNRRTNYLIGERLFSAGPRRPRERALSRQFRAAVAAHPLHDDPKFRTWLDAQSFAEAVVADEGLAFTTDRHPVYGRLVWVEPWAELPSEIAEATAFLQNLISVTPLAPAEREERR